MPISQMQKLLISLTGCASLCLAACAAPTVVDRLPFVHRIDVQQGNVVTQEMVDQLKPGMEKRQVRFVMGAPLLVDIFHQERWDYVYTMRSGRKEKDHYRLSLYFAGDTLARLEGDFKPNAPSPDALPSREALVVVPVLPAKKKGWLDRALGWLGFDEEEPSEETPRTNGADADIL